MPDITLPPAALPDWALGLVDLASPKLGATTVACTDDSFAEMSRMLDPGPAVMKPGVYDAYGKWMDGWESKRRRDGGYDWCVVKLGLVGEVAGFDIDTSHFTGNYPPAAAVWASDAAECPGDDPGAWTEILPSSPLGPSAHHFCRATKAGPWRWLRLNIYPDGGVARLRVYGRPSATWETSAEDGLVELSALANGGSVAAYDETAYLNGVTQLLMPGRGTNMGDGSETRRRRTPGNDWMVVRLGAPGVIERIEVDTSNYFGNYPDRCSFQAAMVDWGTPSSLPVQAMFWPELMGERKLGPDGVFTYGRDEIADLGSVSHVKFNTFPDGGVKRIRLWGRRA